MLPGNWLKWKINPGNRCIRWRFWSWTGKYPRCPANPPTWRRCGDPELASREGWNKHQGKRSSKSSTKRTHSKSRVSKSSHRTYQGRFDFIWASHCPIAPATFEGTEAHGKLPRQIQQKSIPLPTLLPLFLSRWHTDRIHQPDRPNNTMQLDEAFESMWMDLPTDHDFAHRPALPCRNEDYGEDALCRIFNSERPKSLSYRMRWLLYA